MKIFSIVVPLVCLLPQNVASSVEQLRPVVSRAHFPICASWSSDGGKIATGDTEGSIHIWDVSSGRLLRKIAAHSASDVIHSVEFSSNSKYLLSCSSDGTAKIWHVESGKESSAFETEYSFNAGVWSPNGKLIALLGDGRVEVWDLESGKDKRSFTLQHTEYVKSVCWGPNGMTIITGDDAGSVQVWDARSGDRRFEFRIAPNRTNVTVKVHPKLNQCLTTTDTRSSDFNIAKIWDITTGKLIRVLKRHKFQIDDCDWSPDGLRVVTTTSGISIGESCMWDATDGDLIGEISNSGALIVLWSPEGDQVFRSGRRRAEIWDTSGRLLLKTFNDERDTPAEQKALALHPDLSRLVSVGSDNLVRIWNAKKGVPIAHLGGHTSDVTSVAYSPSGREFATGSWDKTAVIWDTQSHSPRVTLKGHTDFIESVAWSPDGSKLVSGSHDSTTRLWDSESGTLLQTWKHRGWSRSIDWSRRTKQIAIGRGDFSVGLIDGQAFGSMINLKKHHYHVRSVEFDSTGMRLASTGDDQKLIIWDCETLQPRVIDDTEEALLDDRTRLAWSPDDRRLAIGAASGALQIWKVESGTKLLNLSGHHGEINAIQWYDSGKLLVTASSDGSIRVWDTQEGVEKGRIYSFGQSWLVLTPDGYFDGSPEGVSLLHYSPVDSNRIIPLERYRKRFEVPGLLAKLLNGEEIGRESDPAIEPPPTVKISTVDVEEDGVLHVMAAAETNGKLPLEKFQLLVDGRPITDNLGVVRVKETGSKKATARWSTKLSLGHHDVTVLAHTDIVHGRSETEHVTFKGHTTPAIRLPKLYILAVGVSDYEHEGIPDLDFAHADATAIVDSFRKHSRELFSDIDVKLLTNKGASKDSILDGLEWLRRSSTQNDYAVFYFGGHGKRDERGELYFLPHDVDPQRLSRTSVHGATVNLDLTSTVGQVTAIFDACHAGAIGNKGRSLTDELLRDLTTEQKGVRVMCSTTGSEEAQESREHQHGVFTQAILEGLSGKAKRSQNDEAVYFKQLDAYVTNRVKELTNGYQHPVTKDPFGARDIPLSKP